MSVKLINAALDEDENKNIVLRGIVDLGSLDKLLIDSYQREILPVSKIKNLMKAYEEGKVPDLDLGMRGGNYLEKEGAFYLKDDVYVIDGLQRVTAAKRCTVADHTRLPRVGAIVHFNTTHDWEKKRFRILNTTNVKLSPSVLIRNMKDEYEVIDMLIQLTKDKTFVLCDKVTWGQGMKRDELITGAVLLKVSGILHSRLGPGLRSNHYMDSITSLQKVYDKYSRNLLRKNIKTFWEVMDECYKVRFISFKEGAVYLRKGFLTTLAGVFADHSNFWDDAALSMSKDLRRKISCFPINDPEVVRLATHSGATSSDILYQLMVRHINSGKRTRRLVPSRKNIKTEQVAVQ